MMGMDRGRQQPELANQGGRADEMRLESLTGPVLECTKLVGHGKGLGFCSPFNWQPLKTSEKGGTPSHLPVSKLLSVLSEGGLVGSTSWNGLGGWVVI